MASWQWPGTISLPGANWYPNWKCHVQTWSAQLARPWLTVTFPDTWISTTKTSSTTFLGCLKLVTSPNDSQLQIFGVSVKFRSIEQNAKPYLGPKKNMGENQTNGLFPLSTGAGSAYFVPSLSCQAGSSTTTVNLPNTRTLWFSMTTNGKWKRKSRLPNPHHGHHSHNWSRPKQWIDKTLVKPCKTLGSKPWIL